MKKQTTPATVWLASIADSCDGVTTRAFSSKAKAFAWKEEWAAAYRGGEAEDPKDPVFDEEGDHGPYFSVEKVRVDTDEFINEG